MEQPSEPDDKLVGYPVPHIKHTYDPLPRNSYVMPPYSLWVVALVVFVAAMFGVIAAELLIWLGGRAEIVPALVGV